ncbi:hypothetical protein OG625_40365 (plasmid) [Streptomyces sp. NBC_01351]|uniref:hypothetical protein n=1 Tax=Streptomyces sp. NBC_01351 TaxID=2903833 RepID=UPI002E332176|nr:hypothetical protein [Streptomyces sp. NBC_01351]
MMFDDASDTLVVRTPGRYLLKARVALSFNAAGVNVSSLGIQVNGGFVALDQMRGEDPFPTQEVSTIVPLNAGDAISLTIFAGTSLDAESRAEVGAAPLSPQLQAELLEP